MGNRAETGQELEEQSSRFGRNRKRLSMQLSVVEKKPGRDLLWERRRKQILKKRLWTISDNENDVTDEDLSELKGCIELGFGFNEEEGGQKLCNTLPALDLYFAVNRQYSMSPVSSPGRHSSVSAPVASPSSFVSPRSSDASDSNWKICSPGEDPRHVKTKLRHWAQAVACSVMQSSGGVGYIYIHANISSICSNQHRENEMLN